MLSLGLAACGSKRPSPDLQLSAGADQTVRGSHQVMLSGSAKNAGQSSRWSLAAPGNSSKSPAKTTHWQYRWMFVSKPRASRLANDDIIGAERAAARFTPDVAGAYVLRLTLDTGAGTASDTVKITSKPAVKAGSDRNLSGEGSVVLHAASNAAHPVYHWRFASKPAGSKAVLSAPASATARFTPDANGTYTLGVTLGKGAASDKTAITVNHLWQPGSTPRANSETAKAKTALVVAADDAPWVAYRDDDDGGRIHVEKFADNHWASAGKAPASAGAAFYVALAAAPDGKPYLAYADYSAAGRGGVTVEKFVAGKWVPLGKPGFSRGEAAFVSLAIAPDGTPWVAWQDFGRGAAGRLTVAKFVAGKWSVAGKRGFSAKKATWISLAIAPGGTPWVAYRDYEDVHAGLSVEKFSGGRWKLAGNRGFSAAPVRFVSLAVAPDGTPYVAYEDGGPDRPASVKKYNGKRWEYAGNYAFTTGEAEFNALTIGSDGTPYLAYQDEVHDGISVRKFTGKRWRFVGRPGFSSGEAEGIALAVAGDGQMYASYRGEERNKDEHETEKGDAVHIATFTGERWAPIGNTEQATHDED